MTPELRSQFDTAKALHTPCADFVQSLEARIAEAPVTAPVSEHFPDQIKRVFEQFIASLVPAAMVPFTSRVATLLLVMGVAVGGWIGAVSASYDTLPGDMLYNVKLATEKVQLVAAEASGDTSRSVRLHTDFTERRATEVQRIVAERPEPERTRQAVDRLSRSVQNATVALQKARVTNSETADMVPTVAPDLFLEQTEHIARQLQVVLAIIPPDVTYLIDEIVRLQGGLTEQRLTMLQDIIRTQVGDQTELTPGETRDIVLQALASISEQSREQVALLGQTMDTERMVSDVPVSATELIEATTTTPDRGEEDVDITSSSEDMSDIPAVDLSTTPPIAVSTSSESTGTVDDLSSLSASVTQDLEVVDILVSEGKLIEALETAKQISNRQIQIKTLFRNIESRAVGEAVEQTVTDGAVSTAVSSSPTTSPSPSSTEEDA